MQYCRCSTSHMSDYRNFKIFIHSPLSNSGIYTVLFSLIDTACNIPDAYPQSQSAAAPVSVPFLLCHILHTGSKESFRIHIDLRRNRYSHIGSIYYNQLGIWLHYVAAITI